MKNLFVTLFVFAVAATAHADHGCYNSTCPGDFMIVSGQDVCQGNIQDGDKNESFFGDTLSDSTCAINNVVYSGGRVLVLATGYTSVDGVNTGEVYHLVQVEYNVNSGSFGAPLGCQGLIRDECLYH